VFGSLPGVVGPKEAVAKFAAAWPAEARLEIAQRAFRVDHVDAPTGVPGRMRDYERGDRELAARWMDAFAHEALPEPPPESSEEFVDRREASSDGGIVLWEDDGAVVSMAGFGGRTPNGIRIGPVYTPPELRGRGYASNLVASVTERQLASGRAFCFLFTDLANSTSNHIYQTIGYVPVTDVDDYRFAALA
jgi:predicted GNAT family acetyltransferase